MRGLQGRTAIVTGGGSGIGRAIARRLAREGVHVGVFDVRMEGAQETVRLSTQEDGGIAFACRCDITDNDSVSEAVRSFEAETGDRTHILINNAGWDDPRPFVETGLGDWSKIVAVNWFGAIHMTHAVAKGMVARKAGGRIINIASDAARVGSSGTAVYAGCKAAMIAFGKSLAREFASAGILVNTICPGATDTPAMRAAVESSEHGRRLRDALVRSTPLGRIAVPEDYEGIAAFLASDEASFITGQVISVSGGLTMVG